MKAARWTGQQLAQHLAEKRARSFDILEMSVPKAVEEERDLQRDCENWLDSSMVWWKHDRNSKGERPGIPDLIMCYCGNFVACELKSKNGKVEPCQRDEMAVIRKTGGRTFVARSLEEFMRKLTDGVNEEWPR